MRKTFIAATLVVAASGYALADIRSVIDTTYSASDYAASRSYALSEVTGEMKPKLKFTASGLVVMDGAVYAPASDGFANGVTLPDIRLGGKVDYGPWEARVDLGFGYGKFSMKDVYIQYTFSGSSSLLRAGYFVHQFGLNTSSSSSSKPTIENPSTDDFFESMSRKLGIMYKLDLPKFYMGVSAFTGTGLSGANTSTMGFTSVGVLGRFVWRPIARSGAIVQVGVSPWYQNAFRKKSEINGREQWQRYFDFGCSFPTRVARVNLLGADITNARDLLKITPELLLSYGPVALESQYYFMNVWRSEGESCYQAQGAYCVLRGLLIGDREYSYSHGNAGLNLPRPRSLELALGYNYTNACSAGINGGITDDYSVTLNYYINKYLVARLGWHYTDVRSSAVSADRQVNTFQARVQFKF